MSVISELIDGVVEITTDSAEFASERLRSLVILALALMVLIFLLIVLLLEPLTGTILALVIAAGVIILLGRADGEVI